MNPHYSDQDLKDLDRFYQQTDAITARLEQKHVSRLKCQKGCHACCLDDLEVFGIEAALIATHNQTLLTNSTPHPAGKCAFLGNEGQCRVYNQRPFVCRTHGLPISWLEETEEGTIEYRDICSLNEEGEPLENLREEEVLHLPPLDEQLAIIQLKADDGQWHRVKLRDLFRS